MIINGVDKIEESFSLNLKKKKIALITGSSNADSSGQPVFKKIKELAGENLKSIWSLQHGFFIDKQDNMIFSEPFYWEELDIDVRSLYGATLLPKKNWIEGIDAIIVDIFDVGTRVYTFVNHIIKIMRSYSGEKIEIIVLDRPNPLGGRIIEGNLAEKEYFSIVGELPVPMRHGLTVGEYLLFAKKYYKIDISLEIIKIENWNRDLFEPLWTYPSPNMPVYNTAIVYPGAVMMEGVNLSEGRGTTRPFEFVGAPFVNALSLADHMNSKKFNGVHFIPIFFKPEFSKFSNEICNGILVSVTNRNTFRSFEVYYEIIRWVYRTYPEGFKWKKPPYEYEYKRPPIDMICGSSSIRESIESDIPFSEIEKKINIKNKEYWNKMEEILLY